MRKISITDLTLRHASEAGAPGFRERIEIARHLNRLNVSTLELARLSGQRADSIFVKTLCTVVTDCTLALPVGLESGEVDAAWDALQKASRPRLVVEAPVSSVQMEYLSHRKPQAMLDTVARQVAACREKCADVEFCALDAARAEEDFLCTILEKAIEAGATSVTLTDPAAVFMPGELVSFLNRLIEKVPALKETFIKVLCDDHHDLGAASAVYAAAAGASGIKTTLIGHSAPQPAAICRILSSKGDDLGLYTGVRLTELETVLQRMDHLMGLSNDLLTDKAPANNAEQRFFDAADTAEDIADGVRSLGYELSDSEMGKVYEAFRLVATRKPISLQELDAIVAANAMQVPATYTLDTYVVTAGNSISATACIRVIRGETETLEGTSSGDGSVDAAFKAIEVITGRHFELEGFHIDAVTEGKEAVGRALIRLRNEGMLYSATGVSTDILGAAIRAYLGALNKIVYEENEA